MLERVFWRMRRQGGSVLPLSTEQHAALERFRIGLAAGGYPHEAATCLCGADTGLLIATRDRYGLPVSTHLCRSCGVLRTSPRMTPSALARFYAEDYRLIYGGQACAPDTFFTEQVRHARQILARVSPHLGPNPPATVFDVGCGAGGMLLPFAETGWRAYGCDIGAAYLERGRLAGLTLVAGDAETLAPYAPARLILLSHVLEHLPDPLATLHRLRDLLEPQGYLWIELPGVFAIHRTYGDTLRFLQNAHLYHFTLGTLTDLLARAGFRLLVGDELIGALFQRDDAARPAPSPGHAGRVLRYLALVEIAHMLYLDRLRAAARRLVRAVRR